MVSRLSRLTLVSDNKDMSFELFVDEIEKGVTKAMLAVFEVVIANRCMHQWLWVWRLQVSMRPQKSQFTKIEKCEKTTNYYMAYTLHRTNNIYDYATAPPIGIRL